MSGQYFWSFAGQHNPPITKPYKGQPLRAVKYTHRHTDKNTQTYMRAHFCTPITNIKGTVCHNWVKFLYFKFCTYVLGIEFFAQARSPLIWAGQHAGLRGS